MSQYYCVQAKLLGILAVLLLAGCGNEFRPVAIPIIPPGGTRQNPNEAIVLSTSSAGGTATNINVSGNTVATVRDLGANPVHGALAAGRTRTVIANDNDTLSTYLNFVGLQLAPVTTISLPPGLEPVFVHSREASNAYVALHAPNPDCGGNGSVAVVSITTLTVTATVCVGQGPKAMAELPSGSKLYVANQLSNDVTVINTADRSIAATIPVGSSPSAIEVTADGTFVYVVNTGSNNVSVISTASDLEVSAPRVNVGGGPNFLKYSECPGQNGGSPTRKRVYVTNPASNSVSVIDADASTSATFLNVSNVAVGSSPTALTAPPNCAKVYVANSGAGANSVSVIDGPSLAVTATVPVGIKPISIDSSPDSTQVFVANEGDPTGTLTGTVSPGNVSVIRTSDDTKFFDVALPPPSNLPPGTPTPIMVPKLLFITP